MELKLPSTIVSPGDINRLSRQLEKLNDYMVGSIARNEDQSISLQQADPLLLQLAAHNNVDILNQSNRQKLKDALDAAKTQAPTIHISFTAEPSRAALIKITEWFRANIHPSMLLRVGLQPNMAAGCMLRANNKVFDLSLKETLKQKKPLLLELIKGAGHER